jgi:hypothetical protein
VIAVPRAVPWGLTLLGQVSKSSGTVRFGLLVVNAQFRRSIQI